MPVDLCQARDVSLQGKSHNSCCICDAHRRNITPEKTQSGDGLTIDTMDIEIDCEIDSGIDSEDDCKVDRETE
eukprot:1415365-Pyramimonas_sp.AAC.1